MSEIKIGEQAKEILSSFANIDKTIILNSEALFTKNDALMGLYTLPEGEVEVDKEIPIDDLKEFLSIEELLDEDSKSIYRENEAIVFKDDKKKFTLAPGFMELMKKLNDKGLKLFEESEDKICKFVITETDISNMKKYRSIISAKEVYIVSEDNSIYVELTNVDNDNNSRIKLEGNIYTDEDFKLQISDKHTEPFFDLIYNGIYEIEIRTTKVQDKDTLLILIKSIDINSDENGVLVYFTSKRKD